MLFGEKQVGNEKLSYSYSKNEAVVDFERTLSFN